MAEETGDGADEARMERIVERVLERQLPSIVARLAASGAATARAETTRSLPSEGGSRLSIFTQFLPSGMMSYYRALTYYCHAGGALFGNRARVLGGGLVKG